MKPKSYIQLALRILRVLPAALKGTWKRVLKPLSPERTLPDKGDFRTDPSEWPEAWADFIRKGRPKKWIHKDMDSLDEFIHIPKKEELGTPDFLPRQNQSNTRLRLDWSDSTESDTLNTVNVDFSEKLNREESASPSWNYPNEALDTPSQSRFHSNSNRTDHGASNPRAGVESSDMLNPVRKRAESRFSESEAGVSRVRKSLSHIWQNAVKLTDALRIAIPFISSNQSTETTVLSTDSFSDTRIKQTVTVAHDQTFETRDRQSMLTTPLRFETKDWQSEKNATLSFEVNDKRSPNTKTSPTWKNEVLDSEIPNTVQLRRSIRDYSENKYVPQTSRFADKSFWPGLLPAETVDSDGGSEIINTHLESR